MRKLIGVLVTALFCAALVDAQEKSMTWEGFLVDKMCGSKMTGEKGAQKAMKHTKECALEDGCKASGYGLVTGGKYVKFTDASDVKAVKFLEGFEAESNLYVKVTGVMDGEKVSVTSIVAAKKASKKTPMKEKKS